jgi:hypothetical protein
MTAAVWTWASAAQFVIPRQEGSLAVRQPSVSAPLPSEPPPQPSLLSRTVSWEGPKPPLIVLRAEQAGRDAAGGQAGGEVAETVLDDAAITAVPAAEAVTAAAANHAESELMRPPDGELKRQHEPVHARLVRELGGFPVPSA